MRSIPIRRILAGYALIATLAACNPTIESHGDLPLAERLAQVTVGRTKADVLALLGTPSTTFSIGSERWYYISSETESYAFFKTKEIERLVIAVDFDKSGVVTAVKKLGLADGVDVAMVGRTTPTAGAEISILGQLVGNIGRFTPESPTQ